MSNLTMTPLKSTNLAGYHYDAVKRRLTIEFHGKLGRPGNRYRYDDVPEELASKLAEAESPGGFFTEHIRNAPGFGGTRLLTEAEKQAMIADGADPADLEDR